MGIETFAEVKAAEVRS